MTFTMTPKQGTSVPIIPLLIACGVIYQLVFHCVDVLRNPDGDEESQHGLRHMRGTVQDVTNEAHGDLSDVELEQLERSVGATSLPHAEDAAPPTTTTTTHVFSMADLYSHPDAEEESVVDDEQVGTSTKSQLALKIKARSQPRTLADLYTEANQDAWSAGLNIRRSADASQPNAPQECRRPSVVEEWIQMLELQVAHQCATEATHEEIKEMYTAPGGLRRLFSRLAVNRDGQDVSPPDEAPASPSPAPVKLVSRNVEEASPPKTSSMLNVRATLPTAPPSPETGTRRIRLR